MSITLRFIMRVNGVATDATSVVLSDSGGTYGVKRNDTNAVVVADGTAMTKIDTGTYSYTFTEPAAGLTYSYAVEYVYNGQTGRETGTYVDASRVITLDGIKTHCRIDTDSTSEDNALLAWIDAATRWAEHYQGRKYLQQTCVDYLDGWPVEFIRPKWAPLASVTKIEYVDSAGTTQTWSSSNYDVDTDSEPGRIGPAYGCSWPTLRGDINGVIVTYLAGYGSSASDVPAHIRSAILMLVAHWYANREEVSDLNLASVPFGVRSLLGIDRVIRV